MTRLDHNSGSIEFRSLQYKRCNDKLDCDDGSDEENCTVVKVPKDYRKGDPPHSSEENTTNLIGETSLTGAGRGLFHLTSMMI